MLQVLSFAVDGTSDPRAGVPAKVHAASRFETVVGQEDALRILPPISELGRSILFDKPIVPFGGGSIFDVVGKSSEVAAGAPASSSSGCAPAPPHHDLSTTGTNEQYEDPPYVVIFSRGQKAAQRCLRLIKILGIPKAIFDHEKNFHHEEHSNCRLSFAFGKLLRPAARRERLRTGGWNLEPLRVLLGDEIIDDCVSRLEKECRTRFGALASLFYDTSVTTTVGLSTQQAAGSVGGAEMSSETGGTETDRRTLGAIVDDIANDSSRFAKEFEALKRSVLSDVAVGAGGCGQSDSRSRAGEEAKDEFRATGPGFSSKFLLVFLDVGERIESDLHLLAQRAHGIFDVPLQIVVTSMNGDDLLKHDRTVFLSSRTGAQDRDIIADVKNLVRMTVRKDSEQERNTLDAEEQRLLGTLGKEFWSVVGGWGIFPRSPELRTKLADGFQEVIFEEPVSTSECGRGKLVLAAGFHVTNPEELREDVQVSRSFPQFFSELRLVPVLYFLASTKEKNQQAVYTSLMARNLGVDWTGAVEHQELSLGEESFYWSGNQLLNFTLGVGKNSFRFHIGKIHSDRGRGRGVPSNCFKPGGKVRFLEGSSKPTSLIFDRGAKAAAAAYAKLTALASATEPVITFYSDAVGDVRPASFFIDPDIHFHDHNWRWWLENDDDDSESGHWFRQTGVSKLRDCTVSPEASVRSHLFPKTAASGSVRMKWNVEILNQLTDGQSAETDRKLREEIDAARLHRCPDFIRAQAENDDPTALDRLEIIPYGSTDICGDDTTLLDLLQGEEYGAEFDDVDLTGKTVATVRFHAVLRAAAISREQGQTADGAEVDHFDGL